MTSNEEGVKFENLSRMNGGKDETGKDTEQVIMTLSSSFGSSESSYSEPGFDRDDKKFDEFMYLPQDHRIPLSAFEPSFPTKEWSMISDAPPCKTPSQDFDINMSSASTTPMKSPSTQSMDRPAGYDPDRIPSSIFSSKPTGACDWSLASNESLFSIHPQSFSKDEAILLQKSQELGLVAELSIPSTNPFATFESKANEANTKSCSNLEPINETESLNGRKLSFCMELDDDPSKQVEEGTWRKSGNQSIGTDASTSVRSGKISGVEGDKPGSSKIRGSGEFVQDESFVFPIWTNEGKKSSSTAIPQSKNANETTKKSKTRWFSFSCFPCCRGDPCSCL